MGYELRVRNADGSTLLAIIPVSEADSPTDDALVDEYGDLLSGYSTATFRIPIHSRYTTDLPQLRRQIQIVKDGRIVWWGRLISRNRERGFWRYQCYSLLWDLFRRYFGPVAANLLTNPSFEDGLTGWTQHNCTADVTSDWRQLGTQAAIASASTYDLQSYLEQIVPVTTFPDLGIAFTLAAWYQLDSAGWLGSAFEDRGILLARSDDGGATLHEDFIEVHTITEETPKDTPLRGEVELLIPAATSCHLVNRLYVQGYDPGGFTRWDAASLTIPESVSTNILGSDVFDLIGAMLIHAQSKGWMGLGLAGSATGVQVIQSHQFFAGGNIGEAMTAFSRDGTADVEIRWNDAGTDKWLQVYGGGKGTYRSEFEFTDGGNGSVAQILEWDEDGEEISNSPRFHGSGDGSDREYGIYTDTSELDGYLFESVDDAPPETPISGLRGLAEQEWERARLPVVKGRLLCKLADIPSLEVGDTCPASLAEAEFLGDLRIYEMQVRPRSGLVEIGVNRAA